MYQTGQLGTIIVGLIIYLAATFSNAAPATSLSLVNKPQSLVVTRQTPLEENISFRRRHAIYGPPDSNSVDDLNVFDKRRGNKEYWAVSNSKGWDIKVLGDTCEDYESLTAGQPFWIGEFRKTGNTIGEGGEGKAISGTWQAFSEDTTDIKAAKFDGVPRPAAIKVSKGPNASAISPWLQFIDSRHIVKVYQYEKQSRVILGKNGLKKIKSIFAFEELAENAYEVLQGWVDQYESIAISNV